MHDVYCEKPEDHPSEFHELSETEGGLAKLPTPIHRAHWDCEPSEEFAASGTWI
jgi:hypothetical protein